MIAKKWTWISKMGVTSKLQGNYRGFIYCNKLQTKINLYPRIAKHLFKLSLDQHQMALSIIDEVLDVGLGFAQSACIIFNCRRYWNRTLTKTLIKSIAIKYNPCNQVKLSMNISLKYTFVRDIFLVKSGFVNKWLYVL